MQHKSEREFLLEVLAGHTDAVAFCQIFFGITQIWDDVIDNDTPVTDAHINKAFWDALISLPENRFYQQHMATLLPLMRATINDWLDANAFEQGDEHHQRLAYVLRDSVSNLVIQCAYLVGGYDWLRHVSLRVREWVYDEPFDAYIKQLQERA